MFPDLINPLDGLFARMTKGPMHRIVIAGDTQKNGIDIEMILRRYGVRIWGREPSPRGDLALLVKSKQAGWAEYLLNRAGVPILSPLSEDGESLIARHGGTMPAPGSRYGTRKQSLVDGVVRGLNGGRKTWIDEAKFAPKKPKRSKKKRTATKKRAVVGRRLFDWLNE